MNVSYSVVNNVGSPEDRSCLNQLGTHWHQRSNGNFNIIEALLFFVAGGTAEAAALPTAIGSVQAT